MKKLVINKNNLELKDINEFVYRPRAIIINSNNEILLGFVIIHISFLVAF